MGENNAFGGIRLCCGGCVVQSSPGRSVLVVKAQKNPGDVNSYRPISLTNTISKLMEKIVVTKLSTLIQNALPPSQAVFRPDLDITDQLLAMDVRKAFATMWQDGL